MVGSQKEIVREASVDALKINPHRCQVLVWRGLEQELQFRPVDLKLINLLMQERK